MLRLDLQIARLRAKHGRDRSMARSLPDLRTRENAPLGNRFTKIEYTNRPVHKSGLIVSHLHKSSYQVLLRSEVPFAGRKV